MTEHDNELDQAFRRRTKQLFDDSTARLDAATRSRLTRARHRALEELTPAARAWRFALLPAGAVAGAALVAWLVVWQTPPPAAEAGLQVATLSDLEILLGEEDLEMLDEEIDFYGWLEEQPEFSGADSSAG
jgi:hypothetical protein